MVGAIWRGPTFEPDSELSMLQIGREKDPLVRNLPAEHALTNAVAFRARGTLLSLLPGT